VIRWLLLGFMCGVGVGGAAVIAYYDRPDRSKPKGDKP